MANFTECDFTEEGHVYRRKGSQLIVPGVTSALASVGISVYRGTEAEDRKALLGSEVHNACALIDRGFELEEIDPRVKPYVDSYLEFKEKCNWLPIPTMVEFGPFIAEVDGMAVGFRIDRVGLLDRKEAVCDIKLPTPKPSHRIQLALYDLCLGEVKRKRFVVQPLPTGKLAKLYDYNDPADYGVARAALCLCNWKKNNKLEDGNEATLS